MKYNERISNLTTVLMYFLGLFWLFGWTTFCIGWNFVNSQSETKRLAMSLGTALKGEKDSNDLTTLLLSSGFILMSVGILSVVFGVVGCVGITKRAHKLIYVFLGVLVLVMTLSLVAGFSTILYRNEMLTAIKSRLQKFVIHGYKANHPEFTAFWDYYQTVHQCCGALSFKDWENSHYTEKSVIQRDHSLVPSTCCTRAIDHEVLQVRFIDLNACLKDAKGYTNAQSRYLNKKGCLSQTYKSVDSDMGHSAGLVIAYGVFQIFGIAAVIVMICYLKKNEMDTDDNIVFGDTSDEEEKDEESKMSKSPKVGKEESDEETEKRLYQDMLKEAGHRVSDSAFKLPSTALKAKRSPKLSPLPPTSETSNGTTLNVASKEASARGTTPNSMSGRTEMSTNSGVSSDASEKTTVKQSDSTSL